MNRNWIKKIISIAVMVVMMFMLCGSAIDSLTDEEREAIFYQVAAEKGLDKMFDAMTELSDAERELVFYQVAAEKGLLQYISGNQETLVVQNSGYDFISSGLPTDVDYVEILDMELVQIDNNSFRPNFKIRNVFPEDVIEYYPDELRLYVSYFDEDGFAIQSGWIRLKHLTYGQGTWTEASGNIFHECNFNITEVKSISVTGYRFMSVKGGVAVYGEDFTFNRPVIFNLQDFLTNDILNSAESNPIAVEEVSFVKNGHKLEVIAKVRNLGSNARDVVQVNFQLLDESGDVIDDGYVVVKNLQPGQAAKGENLFSLSVKSVSEIGSIKFFSYSFGTFGGGSTSSWTIQPGDGGTLVEPYIFTSEQFK